MYCKACCIYNYTYLPDIQGVWKWEVVLYKVWLTQLTFVNINDDENANHTTNDKENGTHHKQRNVPI